jgi:phage shock protein PspC (stress-responsive transcriptional regulator)
MSKKITISGVTISTEKKVDTQIKAYFQLLQNNYEGEVLEDVSNSFLEKLFEISKERSVNEGDLENIKQQIGLPQKPIYKRFFRYKGVLGGVAHGIAQYFNIPVVIPRIIFAIPLITLGLFLLESIATYIIPEQLFYLNIPLIFIANVHDGYTFSSLTENILNNSEPFFLIYLAMWIFVPRAKTDNEIAEINGKDIQDDQLYLAILNKVTYNNSLIKKIITKILFVVARIGIFLFDVLVSILNNFFSSLFFQFLLFVIIISGLLMLILNTVFTARPNITRSETSESSSSSTN